ncbi:MAG: DinB family protein [Bacteroidota bacterium]
MELVISELRQIVESYSNKIGNITDVDFSAKPLPHKWSKKEVLGHLIDSAQNNLRRFICGQYEPAPPKIVYDQDFWVIANGYKEINKQDVITYWKLINFQICSVLRNMPAGNYAKVCDTGKTSTNLHSLQWLAEDYVKHLKHHLNQIIPGSFDIVYP